VSIEVAIICDGCGWAMAGGKTAAEARQDVRDGKGRTGLPGGKDLCGQCVTEGKAPE